jgi:hypothetical protein
MYVMTSIQVDLLRTERLFVEIAVTEDGFADAIYSRFKP